jgi:SAM-dependent methyltransferase
MRDQISPDEGQRLFGLDPAGYDAVRPEYPAWIFTELADSGALTAGASILEIGPGTGLATRRLIERGAKQLTLVEPDERLHKILRRSTAGHGDCRILHARFEDAELTERSFDLIVAATCFHWLDPDTRLRRMGRLLRDGGTVALMWNVLTAPGRPDPFHDATRELLAPLAVNPSGGPEALPFALDRTARAAEARRAGFEMTSYSESRWTLRLSATQIGTLYGTFSHIQRLEPRARARTLEALVRVAEDAFEGHVERNVTSCLYRLVAGSGDRGK